ncbi:hypothetical protein TrLO_g15313 [Triparma laevis f. longispina]|uniref:Uncharacterized protein n=1 Tax=Triparma laevis f. longispina TaxID=1714387 RepID=A0A9W7FQD4_9STRA|nr:hypothetical protein TrLO_g15313 [Triparma laevis f. longispina]
MSSEDAPTTTASGLRGRVQALLRTISDNIPHAQRQSFAESVCSKLMESYDKTHVSELINCGANSNLDDDGYRQILFFPSPKDALFYPKLIMSSNSSVQIPFTVMLYLSHTYNHGSFNFAREFIKGGGLKSLTELCVSENIHLRGQAVDTLLQLTAHEGFDWFAALPETLPLKEKKDVISLHRGFLNIRDSNFVSNMLKNAPWNPSFPGGSYLILQILAFWMSWVRAQHCDNNVLYLSNEVLESLRKWKECEVYEMDGEEVTTTGRVLQEEKELAKRLFGDFSRFVGHEFRTDDPLIFGDKKEVLDSWRGSISAEEASKRRLEKQQKQQPPKPPRPDDEPNFIPSATFTTAKPNYVFKKGDSGVGYYWDVDLATSLPPLPPPTPTRTGDKHGKVTLPPPPPGPALPCAPKKPRSSMTQREIGNDCFIEGDYEEALKYYGAALSSGETIDLDDLDGRDDDKSRGGTIPYSSNVQIVEVVESDARAILHCNRSACYLKIVQKTWGMKVGDICWSDVDGGVCKVTEKEKAEGRNLLTLAEAEGRASINFDKTFAKGYFRTGQALALQDKLKEALAIAKLGITTSPDSPHLDSLDEFCGSVLTKLHEAKKGNKESDIMAKIMGRKTYGKKLKDEQVAVARRRKEEKEKARFFGVGGIEEKEGGDEEGVIEVDEQNDEENASSTALVPVKKKTVYEDDEDEDDYDPDDYWSREKKAKKDAEAGFHEVSGADSDDDDAPVARKSVNKRVVTKKKGGEIKGKKTAPPGITLPSPPSEDIAFLSSSNKSSMADILTMGKKSRGAEKKKKDGTKKLKKENKKTKKDDNGLADVLKLGKATSKINFDA